MGRHEFESTGVANTKLRQKNGRWSGKKYEKQKNKLHLWTVYYEEKPTQNRPHFWWDGQNETSPLEDRETTQGLLLESSSRSLHWSNRKIEKLEHRQFVSPIKARVRFLSERGGGGGLSRPRTVRVAQWEKGDDTSFT